MMDRDRDTNGPRDRDGEEAAAAALGGIVVIFHSSYMAMCVCLNDLFLFCLLLLPPPSQFIWIRIARVQIHTDFTVQAMKNA